MSKEQCKELVRQIFGDEAANEDDIVQWYFDVNQVAMDDHAKSEMEAFDRWKKEEGWDGIVIDGDLCYVKNIDEALYSFSDLYELYKQSKK